MRTILITIVVRDTLMYKIIKGFFWFLSLDYNMNWFRNPILKRRNHMSFFDKRQTSIFVLNVFPVFIYLFIHK